MDILERPIGRLKEVVAGVARGMPQLRVALFVVVITWGIAKIHASE